MAFDREATLKQGEKFLRQGRLDAAIAEYLQVVTANPQDWNTANLLGDLYVRAQQVDDALPHYHRIGEHLMEDGRHGKAATLYKKVLKLRPDDEPTQMLLAELAARQGQLADAKAYLTTVGDRRRGRGDRDGAADVAERLATLDRSDMQTRLSAARTLEEMGRPQSAAGHFRTIYGDLQGKGQTAEALDALRDAVRLNGADREGRTILARTAVEAGNVLGAQPYLDRDTAGKDPMLLAALVEVDLRTGQRERARGLMTELLAADPGIRHRLLTTAWALIESDPEAAYLCIDAIVDTTVSRRLYEEAAQHLQTFTERRRHHVPGLLRLVEVCVDGDLRTRLSPAQARLADAYLEAGQATEARVVAEDLLAREPEDTAHIDRLRRALVMLDVADPERHIADCLASLPEFEPLDLDDAPMSPATPALPGADAPATVVEAGADEDATAGLELSVDIDVHATEAAAAVPAPAPAAGFSTSADRIEPAVTRLPGSEPVIKLSAMPLDVDPVVPLPARDGIASTPAPNAGTGKGAADGEAAPTDEFFEDVDLSFLLGDDQSEKGAVKAGSADLDSPVADRRGDAAADEDDEFAAQYVKLAQTYVDMGMDDEAISSLQTAVKSVKHRYEAASMLGRLYLRQGKQRQAAEWLSKAAECPAPNVQEGRALLYDLGVTLDGAGQPGRALGVFLELQAEAGDYRDVPSRIDRLARVESGG